MDSFDPSEFESMDEDLGVEYEQYLDEPLTDEELDEVGNYLSVPDDHHSDFWNDFTEVNEDDIPW